MVCESHHKPSCIFRLPQPCQSATIPRCLIVAVRGQTNPNGPRAERQGQSKAFRRGRNPEARKENASGPPFHSFFTPVEIPKGLLFLIR